MNVTIANTTTRTAGNTAAVEPVDRGSVLQSRILIGYARCSTDRQDLQALAAVRAGDTLVVPKLDRLARSVPDARAIGDSLAARGIRLSLGGTVYDPNDPMGKCLFNILATFAEFEVARNSRSICCGCAPARGLQLRRPTAD